MVYSYSEDTVSFKFSIWKHLVMRYVSVSIVLLFFRHTRTKKMRLRANCQEMGEDLYFLTFHARFIQCFHPDICHENRYNRACGLSPFRSSNYLLPLDRENLPVGIFCPLPLTMSNFYYARCLSVFRRRDLNLSFLCRHTEGHSRVHQGLAIPW